MLNGETGKNEKSIKIALNQSILATSIDEALDDFSVAVNGIIVPINSFEY